MIPGDIHRIFTRAIVIGGNLVPFYGIMFWDWDIFSIFFLYWAENAVIGIYTLIMMAVHEAARGIWPLIGVFFPMAFFIFHYGMFCMVHLAILTEIFGPPLGHKNFQPEDILPLLLSPKIRGFYIAIAGLALGRAVHCLQLYIRIYSKISNPQYIMFAPYGRIIVLHVGILAGGLLAQQMGQPLWALAVLVALKSLYDLAAVNMGEQDDAKWIADAEKKPVKAQGVHAG